MFHYQKLLVFLSYSSHLYIFYLGKQSEAQRLDGSGGELPSIYIDDQNDNDPKQPTAEEEQWDREMG